MVSLTMHQYQKNNLISRVAESTLVIIGFGTGAKGSSPIVALDFFPRKSNTIAYCSPKFPFAIFGLINPGSALPFSTWSVIRKDIGIDTGIRDRVHS